MLSRYVVYRDDVEPRQAPGSPAQVRPLLTESFGCTYLTQAVLTIAAGTTLSHNCGAHEELLFVLRGHGNLLLDGTSRPFGPESGIYIGPDETYQLEITDGGGAEVVRVQVVKPAG